MTGLLLMLSIYITIYLRNFDLTDLIFSSFIMACILYYPVAFIFQRIQLLRWLKKIDKETSDVYHFKFDENGYTYKTEKYTTELKWNYFENFEYNEKEAVIYLYTKNKRLADIVTSRLLKRDNFEKIAALIETNVSPRYN